MRLSGTFSYYIGRQFLTGVAMVFLIFVTTIFIFDAVEMMRRMMETENCEGKTLNLGLESPELAIREVASECYRAVGKTLVVDCKNPTEGSPIRRAPDMSVTKLLTGYSQAVSITQGIENTYAWYKTNVFKANSVSAI